MAYLLLVGDVVTYPFEPESIRALYPDTSFPDALDGATLGEFGVIPVAETARPTTTAEKIVEEVTPTLVSNQWRQAWAVRNRTADELILAKQAKWEACKTRRDQAIDAGFTVTGVGKFDTDPVSRANITGAVTGAVCAQMASQPFSISWKLFDNSTTTLTASQMISVGMAILGHVSNCHSIAQGKGSAIAAAANFAGLNAVEPTVGWP